MSKTVTSTILVEFKISFTGQFLKDVTIALASCNFSSSSTRVGSGFSLDRGSTKQMASKSRLEKMSSTDILPNWGVLE